MRAWLPLLMCVCFATSSTAEEELAAQVQSALKAATAVVNDSVVQIRTVGGLDQVEGVLVGTGPTTGMVIDAGGWVVSSAYNFAEKPSSIIVMLPNGQRASATLVATDHSRMFVLLKVNTDVPLSVPPMSTEPVKPGQWSIAVGKTYDPARANVSLGIVSAVDRMQRRAIQTDAKISAVNYGGPLIDISGRVMGILVPMSPQSDSVVAGTEWYDSGIGFAVSVDQVLARLEALKAGQDQWPGKLGVALAKGPAYSTAPKVATVVANSPAAKAGLKKDDIIIAIDGKSVATQTQLQFELKHRYAGDQIAVVVRRGDDEIEATATLVDKLKPYAPGYLGVLPQRQTSGTAGVQVGRVFDQSAALLAKLESGDLILQINDNEVSSATEAVASMQGVAAGERITVTIKKGDAAPQEVSLTSGEFSADIPATLPMRRPPDTEPPAVEAAVGDVDLRFADRKEPFAAYVPRTYRADVPHGIVLWLTPESISGKQLAESWGDACDRHDVIIVAVPIAQQAVGPEEATFVAEVLDHVSANYKSDALRVVVAGTGEAAAAALDVAAKLTEQVQGVIAVRGAVRRRQQEMQSDPARRLAILAVTHKQPRNPRAQAFDRFVNQMQTAKVPVSTLQLADEQLSGDDRSAIIRWVDTLDRF